MERFSPLEALEWYDATPIYRPNSVVSLFAGCGGTTLGAIASGFAPIWANDINPYAAQLYRQNIGYIDETDILEACRSVPKCDLLVASPPCKNYSSAKAGRVETNLDLLLASSTTDAIKYAEPEYLLIENVPAYFKSEAGKHIIDSVSSLGYHFSVDEYKLQHFGVPQTRRRSLLLGCKSRTHLIPKPSLDNAQSGCIFDLVNNLKQIDLPNWMRKRLAEDELPDYCLLSRSGSGKRIQVKTLAEPCFTIRAMSGSKSNPHQLVIKVKSCYYEADTYVLARLQTFPDSYVWGNSFRRNVEAIGNAVPPEFARQAIAALTHNH